MKTFLSLITLVLIVTACKNGWTVAQRNDFVNTCAQSAARNIGQDKAKAYCSCMQQKLEAKFSNYQDANKNINASGAMQTPEMSAMVQACLNGGNANTNVNTNNNGLGNPIGNIGGNNNNGGGGWSQEDKQKIMNECVNHVAVNFDNASKQKFCNCFVGKMMQKYANYNELDRNTTIEEGKQVTQDCVNELNINEGNINNHLGTTWTNDDEQTFMNTCLKNAMNSGADRQTATSHCSCTLKKIEAKYQSYNEAYQKMTPTEVTQMEQECNANNNQ